MVPPRIAVRSASLRPGLAMTWSTGVSAHENGYPLATLWSIGYTSHCHRDSSLRQPRWKRCIRGMAFGARRYPHTGQDRSPDQPASCREFWRLQVSWARFTRVAHRLGTRISGLLRDHWQLFCFASLRRW